ncbi:hypothetical protein C1H46_034386 [Malus baccata]|uniref:Uncharacterized protein n=1 Tax=Malus baccata TaxID=106549 RepID=A0A540L0P4_MALBA|nr:hypothetical protein C1H46_034386 [Malus baccata]
MEMEMKTNSAEGKPFCLKPKPGGVVPAKRRSVKSLILDDILQCFQSLLPGPTSSTAASPSAGVLADDGDKAKASSTKKIMIISNHVYPSPP